MNFSAFAYPSSRRRWPGCKTALWRWRYRMLVDWAPCLAPCLARTLCGQKLKRCKAKRIGHSISISSVTSYQRQMPTLPANGNPCLPITTANLILTPAKQHQALHACRSIGRLPTSSVSTARQSSVSTSDCRQPSSWNWCAALGRKFYHRRQRLRRLYGWSGRGWMPSLRKALRRVAIGECFLRVT